MTTQEKLNVIRESHTVYPPGELLREELEARSEKCKHCGHIIRYTQQHLSKDSGMSERAISEIIKNKRRITVRTAKQIAKGLGTSWEMWLRLQQDYDIYKENNK